MEDCNPVEASGSAHGGNNPSHRGYWALECSWCVFNACAACLTEHFLDTPMFER